MFKFLPTIFFIFISLTTCTQSAKINGPTAYNFNAPEVTKMPADLNEISGIAFNNGNPDTIFAEQDEDGRLFYFSSANINVKNVKFGKRGDYEDIAINNRIVYMLRSDGKLFSFPLDNIYTNDEENVQEFKDLLPKGEYEAMYADGLHNYLYVLCKSCNDDDATKSISGYVLKIGNAEVDSVEKTFQINTRDIAKLLNEKKIDFKPSAMAFNQFTNEWYVLSSVNKLLVITDQQWKVKEAIKLDPQLFTQPEGIAFDKEQALYISNERGILESATILKFALSKK
ncbi:MAG: SdiA-regulated domain-containing protein [Ferruginibacter sp.]